MDGISESLAKARNTGSTEDMLYHFGRGSNTKHLQERIIKGKLPPLIRTGFKTYDEQCGGVREKSVVILTANTGGLKSTLALNMATNMYEAGNNTAIASFEMDEDEVAIRFVSGMSGVPMSRILSGETTAKERNALRKAFAKFEELGQGKKCRFTILSATDCDLGIDQTLATLAPFGYKVIFIDYVSLLADADRDDQWKALSQVARKCKLFAKRNNCVIVLLAQLSDDDKIRYSKGIAEHADVWWRWRINDEERETGVFSIHQAKARNGRIFSWEQGVEFEINKIYNLSDSAFTRKGTFDPDKFMVTDDEEDNPKGKNLKGKKRTDKKRHSSEIEEIDGDEEVASLWEDA
jgi:replicative DNA helicase